MPTASGTIYACDRSNFNQRFDAEVDPRGTITIVCRVKFDVDARGQLRIPSGRTPLFALLAVQTRSHADLFIRQLTGGRP